MKLQPELDRAFAASAALLGETFSYSRLDSPASSAIEPFSITGFVNSSGQFASPEGPIAAELTVRIVDIPDGPQKGDRVVWNSVTYLVQKFSLDREVGTVALDVRRAKEDFQ